MEPALVVAFAWLLFAGTHIGLATAQVRARLMARFGMWGFVGFFSVIAALSFTLLVHTYADLRFEGAPGLALGALPLARAVLIAAIVVGMMLVAASLVSYPRSPMAIGSKVTREPRGIERITRHGFFAGIALIGTAHVFLATRLVGTVFAAGLVVLTVLGAWHQDRKLLALRGPEYARYLATTSAIPFAAIVSGRQRLVWSELPLGALATGVGLAFLLRGVHASIFAHGGLWVVAVTLGGAGMATLKARRAARRQAEFEERRSGLSHAPGRS